MKKTLLSFCLLAAIPFCANAADGISYSYFELGYMDSDTDLIGDADGWGIRSSAAFAPNFHMVFAYDNQDPDARYIDDRDHWSIGVGYNREVNRIVDLNSRIAYQRLSLGHGYNFNGYSAEVGIRAAFNPHIEGLAMVGWEDYRKKRGVNPDSQFYARLGAVLKFTRNWGVAGDVKLIDGGDHEWFIGPRLSW